MNREQFLALLGKGADIGSRGAAQQMEQRAQLEALIKGKQMDAQGRQEQALFEDDLKGKRQDKNLKIASDKQKELGPNYRVSATDSGISFSETPKDPLAGYLRGKAFEEAKTSKLNDKTKSLSETVEKIGLPALSEDLRSVYKNWKGGESVTPVMNMIPGSALQGVAANIKGDGAGEEFQALQRLANREIKELSGTAVTMYEEGRNKVQRGMAAGGTPDMVKEGIAMMHSALQEQQKNIRGGYDEEVVNKYLSNRQLDSWDNMLPPNQWKKPDPTPQAPAAGAQQPPMTDTAQAPQAPGTANAAPQPMSKEEFLLKKRQKMAPAPGAF